MASCKRGGDERLASLASEAFGRISSVLGEIFSVSLGVPNTSDFANEKSVKQFCVGLLEPTGHHAWSRSLSKIGVRERLSVSGSLFLARKVLPFSPDPTQMEKHMALMSTPAQPTLPGFEEFIDREVDAIFRPGWDKRYMSYVFNHKPSSSSCLEYNTREGGVSRYLTERGRDWFEDQCLSECTRPMEYNVKYSIVKSGGKDRGVTISSGYSHVLAPLHRMLYDHCSGQRWLLRGEARARKMAPFRRSKGEVFVSGDYESATDNLSMSVSYRILSRILSRCRNVPHSLRDYALRSLQASIYYTGIANVVVQQRGQLMGNFLSFPLLCLYNYFAFRFAIPREVPVRINGDDIVFRCRPHEYDRWREVVGRCGLVLSVGKTLVDSRCFSLNSAFFVAESSRPRDIPVIRTKWFVPSAESVPDQQTFARAIRGWTGVARRLVGGCWLRSWRNPIQASGRSVVEGLGIRADNSQLHTANLAVREAFFRGSMDNAVSFESPLPPIPRNRPGPQDDWVKAPTSLAKGALWHLWSCQYKEACVEARWNLSYSTRRIDWDGWWEAAKSSGQEPAWLSWKRTTRRVHSMGFRGLNLRLRTLRAVSLRKKQWMPADEFSTRQSLFNGVGFGCR